MKAIILCRFDPVLGAVIFLKTSNSMSQKELIKIPPLMVIPTDDFFIHTFETFKTANLLIKLPSPNARGRNEKFLISFVTELDSALDLTIGKDFLSNFSNDFINLEDGYKALDIESKGYKGDLGKLNEIKSLFFSFFKTIRPAIDALELSEYNLKERVKELTCLYGLSKLVENPDISIEEILQGTVDLIPPAWQFPEITCAKIKFGANEYKTSNFKETDWELTSITQVNSKKLIIDISYLDDKPFLKEEEYLIDDIGKRLKAIIEQKEAEQKIRESEEKFRTMTSSAHDAIIQINHVGDIVYWNKAAENMLGYSSEEVLSRNIFLIIPERYRKAFGREMLETKKSPESNSKGKIIEVEGLRKDGTEFPTELSFSFFHIKGKRNSISIVRDITERKKAEEEIRLQSEIIENMSEGVFLIKLDDGTIVFTNPALDELFGYNPRELSGKNVAIVNASTDKTPEETREEIKGILKDTGEWHGEVLNVKKDGTLFWCYANISLFDHPEHGMVFVSVNTDITERILYEKHLQRTRNQLDQIFNASTPMYVTDIDFNIIKANERFGSKFLIDVNEIIGTNCYNVWKGKLCHTDDCSLEMIKKGVDQYEYEMEKRLDNDSMVNYLVKNYPYRNHKNKLIGCIKTFTDITDRIKIEE